MAINRLTNEFMEKTVNDSAWKELSENFQWTAQMLEKHKNNVYWKEISENENMMWTPNMLDRFKKQIDWKTLSDTNCKTILTEVCLERFQDYWDWSVLSENCSIKLTYPLIDKFIDRWDWSALINVWHQKDLYSIDFLERYADKIPYSQLQGTYLWSAIVAERAEKLKNEVILL